MNNNDFFMKYNWNPKTPFNDMPDLPPANFSQEEISPVLLKEAGEALAELRGYSRNLPTSLNHLLNPVYLEESLFSSKIENINTTLESVLEQELSERAENETDKKVLNYREAIIWGWEKIKEGNPITQRVIEGLHDRLLPQDKSGFREQQNKIINDTNGETRFTPPSPTEIGRLLSNWEKFVNENEGIDPLIKAALAHYQFEAIHPFEDGNGRVGRMLIVLQLIRDEIISGPSIKISRYINNNREKYYQLLLDVTAKEEWKNFVEFLLSGFKKEATETQDMLMQLDRLSREVTQKLQSEAGSIYSAELVEAIFTHPIINPTRLAEEIGVHYQTASKYLRRLEELDILRSYKKGRKRLFVNGLVWDIISTST